MFKKSKLNFIIDIFMFIVMAAIVGIGFLMKYILIPGKDRWIKYGKNVDLYFADLDRHEWGSIHLILGFILLGLLVLHIIFHWRTIVCFIRNYMKNSVFRNMFIILFIALSFILLLLPFFFWPFS